MLLQEDFHRDPEGQWVPVTGAQSDHAGQDSENRRWRSEKEHQHGESGERQYEDVTWESRFPLGALIFLIQEFGNRRKPKDKQQGR